VVSTQTYNYAKFDYPNASGPTTAFGINDRGEFVGEYLATTTRSEPTVPFPIVETFRGVYVFNDAGFRSKAAELIKSTLGFRPGSIVDAYAINNNGDTPIASQDFKFGRLIDQSIVYGNNDLGSSVGFLSDGTPGDNFSQYHYSYGVKDAGGFFSLVSVPESTQTVSRDINNKGEIAGYYTDILGHTHGFIYSHQTFMNIDFPAASNTKVYGLDDLGQVVGSYVDATGQHSFVDTSGAFVTLQNGFEAYGINNSGQISGTYTDQAGTHGSVATLQGPDTLTLHVSEDSSGKYSDAQFVVKVDGVLFGGIQTVSALHSSGQTNDITLTGNFVNASNIDVSFFNDQYDYKTRDDVNLYVERLAINGYEYNGSEASVDPYIGLQTGTSTELFRNGSAHFVVGTDTLTLRVSEDAWAYHPDAQFVVKVDGQQVGGVLTTDTLHSTGTYEEISLKGNFADSHQVTVEFINDQYGGPSDDVNLYVESLSVNGVVWTGSEATFNPTAATQIGSTVQLYKNGSATFNLAPDTLALRVSEDAWTYHPDAQFALIVDGKQVGEAHSVTALHAQGQSDTFSFTGDFSQAHQVAVSFLNDQYGGAGQDVNLYVDSISLNGQVLNGSAAVVDAASGTHTGTSVELFQNGSAVFNVDDLHHVGMLV
jgi:hypothetical protein